MIREIPANPNIRVYHTRHEMTRAVSEIYRSAETAIVHPLASVLLEVSGVIEVCFFRYQIRLRKSKTNHWESLSPEIESKLQHCREGVSIEDFTPDVRHAMFPIPGHVDPFDRLVFEGCEWARQHPLARSLFEVDGVTEVILEGNQVSVKKGRCYDWSEMTVLLQKRLGDYCRQHAEGSEG